MNQTIVTILRLHEQLTGKGGRRAAHKQMEELRASLPPNVLRRFDYLVQRGRGPLAPLSEADACGSCHMRLPHGVGLEIRGMTEEVHNCPYCGCFLYALAPHHPVVPVTPHATRLRA